MVPAIPIHKCSVQLPDGVEGTSAGNEHGTKGIGGVSIDIAVFTEDGDKGAGVGVDRAEGRKGNDIEFEEDVGDEFGGKIVGEGTE